MKNKTLIYKIALTVAVLVSLLCNVFPIVSARAFGYKLSVSTLDFFNMDFMEQIFGAVGEVNYIGVVKVLVVILILADTASAVVAWIAKKRVLHLVEIVTGALQTGIWILIAVSVSFIPELQDILGEYLFLGIGLWGFILSGLAMLVLGLLLMKIKQHTVQEGAILGVSGEYTGARIPVDREIIIGRDQNSCNIVITQPDISRRHCGISYDARRNVYAVMDYSSNGTFLEDGTRLRRESATELHAGDVIKVGKQDSFRML